MKFISILLFFCSWSIYGWGQPSLSDANDKITGHYTNGNKQYEGYKRHEKWNDEWKSWHINGQLLDSGLMQNGIPDGTWVTHYKNGPTQFVRTYSSDKWLQFQNEKERYHPKRISMPVTKLFHENRKQAEKYIKPVNTFCAKKNCVRVKEDFLQIINNNTEQEHYHPLFENGLLHGPFANYFPDGPVKDSGNYKNGLPEGIWIKWTDDKQFYWKGYYQHGLKNKEWKLYSSNAKLIRIIFYRNDKYLWRKDIKEGIEIDE